MTLLTGATEIVADGVSQVSLRASLVDTNGNPVQGVPVAFSSTAGALSAATDTTDVDGIAQVLLTSSTTAGNATVRAEANGFNAASVIQFIPGAPASVNVIATPNSVGFGGTVSVTADVLDANNNRVPDESVSFSTNGTGRYSSALATTDDNGRSTTTYVVGGAVATDQLTASTAGGANGTAAVNIVAVAQTVGSLAISVGAAQAPVGGDEVLLDAIVLDTTGTPQAGVTVAFEVSAGTLTAATATSDTDGRARTSVLTPNFATTLTARASTGGFIDEDIIAVVPGDADAANSSITANPATLIADGTSTSTVTVLLNDAFGNPLPDGRNVTLLANGGQVVGGNTASLSSGRATFVFDPLGVENTFNLNVQDVTALTATVVSQALSQSTGDPASISFTASTTRIAVTGVGQNDQTTISVTVQDSAGNPISEDGYGNAALDNLRAQFISRPDSGVTLFGRNAAGNVISSNASGILDVRTSNGVKSFTLQSGTVPGVVEIRFSVLGFAGSDFTVAADVAANGSLPQVSIASGPPHTIAFTTPITNAIENIGGGNYRLQGTADVTDRYGNSVPDGTVLNLTVVDSVILHDNQGTVTAGAATLMRAGNSLITRRCQTDPAPGNETDCTGSPAGAFGDASSFVSSITRNDLDRQIQSGDQILIRNGGNPDKRRVVTSVDSATQLTANADYVTSVGGNAEFWVGAALSGGQVAGFNEDGSLEPGTGTVIDGLLPFRVTYPANVRSILTGCLGYFASGAYSDRDRRDRIPQSRQVIVSASAGNGVSGIDASNFCFKAIAGGSLSVAAETVTLAIDNGVAEGDGTGPDESLLALQRRDGGDTIPLPYTAISCFVSNITRADTSSFSVTASTFPNSDGDLATGVNGTGAVLIQRLDDGTGVEQNDNATVTCVSGDADAVEITVTPL